MNHFDEKLLLMPVNELLGQTFIIPAYQRGYRWERKQVKAVLNDIWNFHIDNNKRIKERKSPTPFYCLQPIVVSKRVINDNDCWEIIDGQQRLTTIFLILNCISHDRNFNLQYDTKIKVDIDNLNDINANNDIESFYLYNAKNTIEDWFKNKSKEETDSFRITLLSNNDAIENVRFIWYNVTDENISNEFATNIFARLNIGKIPLTNAELVKALFLTHIEAKGNEDINLKQIQIASEWDRIEQTLQQEDFWYFISSRPDSYETHIEYIFDIMMKKSEDDEDLFTFYKFDEDIKTESVNKLWLKVKQMYQTFVDWYEDQTLYHLVGFLITAGKSVQELLDLSKDGNILKTKSRFKEDLKKELKEYVYGDIESEDYYNEVNAHNKGLTLLLFNVLSILDNPKSAMRFPFVYYRCQSEKGWDIEHVSSQTPNENKKDWIISLLFYFTGISINDILQDFSKVKNYMEEKKDDKSDPVKFSKKLVELYEEDEKDKAKQLFESLSGELNKYFENQNEFRHTHSIGNLVLLDQGTNRMYHNAFFPVKRSIIISQAKHGIFIPPCTMNVFMKAYSHKMGNIMYWSDDDSEDYLNEIKRILLWMK